MPMRTTTHWAIGIAWLLVAAGASLAAPPANDDCVDALPIFEGATPFSTIDATTDGPPHGSCKFDPQAHNDVWHQHIATCNGDLTVSICGTADYETDLVIYDGCDCGSLPQNFLDCDEDGGACPGLTSELTAPVNQGQCYLVRIGGFFSTSEGSGTVSISCTEFDEAACCLPDETCTVTSFQDCQAQGGEFQSEFETCATGVCGLSQGADVIYSDSLSVANWGAVGGVRGYSLQSSTCNIGDTDLLWNSEGPLLAMNAFRLQNGQLRQIGMSWVKNATTAIAGSGCEPPCMGGGGPVLGPGCQDVYSASFNGGHSRLGPRSDVNAFTGTYPGPSGGGGNQIYKRLQVVESELSPADGLYFIEGHYVAPDDAAADNALNNASYKRVDVQTDFDLIPQGDMFESIPAIFAWRDHGLGVDTPDASVQIETVDVPAEGRFHVAAKVTDLGAGNWRYDYAARNHNSHRSGGSFSVPILPGTNVSSVGFHDVDYHSGEPFDNTDWTIAVSADSVTWTSPQTFAQNPNTNALRFATMYNFWFEADRPPQPGVVVLGLFRPEPGGPDTVTASVSVPSGGAAAPAGAVPDGDGVLGTPLSVARSGLTLQLSWEQSCLATDLDYAVYSGPIGQFGDLTPSTCSTGGATSTALPLGSESRFYLVVPLSSNREGSYGRDSDGIERAPAGSACRLQDASPCP